jgi:hypothetical protein
MLRDIMCTCGTSLKEKSSSFGPCCNYNYDNPPHYSKKQELNKIVTFDLGSRQDLTKDDKELYEKLRNSKSEAEYWSHIEYRNRENGKYTSTKPFVRIFASDEAKIKFWDLRKSKIYNYVYKFVSPKVNTPKMTAKNVTEEYYKYFRHLDAIDDNKIKNIYNFIVEGKENKYTNPNLGNVLPGEEVDNDLSTDYV